MTYKKIGILGGMGPEATAELYLRIIRLFQERLGAKLDEDFPNIFMNSVPLPDVVLTTSNNKQAKKFLIKAAQNLERSGADFIVIPCNTVEIFIKDIRGGVNIPVISIVEEVRKLLESKGIKEVGLLATETTQKYRTYEKELSKSGIKVKQLENMYRKELTKTILNILAGKKLERDKKGLKSLIKSFNTEYVILGCTDLPLLSTNKNSDVGLIDTLDILAKTAFEFSTNRSFQEKGSLKLQGGKVFNKPPILYVETLN